MDQVIYRCSSLTSCIELDGGEEGEFRDFRLANATKMPSGRGFLSNIQRKESGNDSENVG
jgi:hypothetical protein